MGSLDRETTEHIERYSDELRLDRLRHVLPHPVARRFAAARHEMEPAAKLRCCFGYVEHALRFLTLVSLADAIHQRHVPDERLTSLLGGLSGIGPYLYALDELSKATPSPFIAELPNLMTRDWKDAAHAVRQARNDDAHQGLARSDLAARDTLASLAPSLRSLEPTLWLLGRYTIGVVEQLRSPGERRRLGFTLRTFVGAETSGPVLPLEGDVTPSTGLPILISNDTGRALHLSPFFGLRPAHDGTLRLTWLHSMSKQGRPQMRDVVDDTLVEGRAPPASSTAATLDLGGYLRQRSEYPGHADWALDAASLGALAELGRPATRRYLKLQPLGSGGMGEIWEAFDTQLRRRCALKRLRRDKGARSSDVARLRREAHLLSKFNDPRVVQVYDIIDDDPAELTIVMALAEGEDLQAGLLAGPLTVASAIERVIEVLEALEVIHDHGVVHRDVKPSNFIATPQGLKIVDFGIAGITGDRSGHETRALLGTERYMAPEQRDGLASTRSDIFGAGRVLYALLVGKPPAHDADLPSHAVDVPPSLDAIYTKATARSPDDRFGSAVEMIAALREVKDRLSEGASTSPPPIAPRLERVAAFRVVSQLTSAKAVLAFSAERVFANGTRQRALIRTVNPEDSERSAAQLRHELEVLQAVPSSAFPRILDVGEAHDELALVVEDLSEDRSRCTLATLLRRSGHLARRLPAEVAVLVAYRVAEAIHAFHEVSTGVERGTRSYGHVWPVGILATAEGRILLPSLDFTCGEDLDAKGRTLSQLRYFAPEQASGAAGSERADVFSVALVLWEMLAMRQARRGTTREEILAAAARSVEPPTGHPRLEMVLRDALARDPGQRPPTCRSLADALLGTGAPVGPTSERALGELVRDAMASSA